MSNSPTLAEYLDGWLAVQGFHLQPSTLVGYRRVVRLYVPHIGDCPIDDLTGRDVTLFYARILNSGGQNGRALSPGTVRTVHKLLRKALQDAADHGLVDHNPCDQAVLPKRRADGEDVTKDTIRVWTPEQVRTFVDFCDGNRYRDLWIVALGTGMRRAELLGLGRGDVDLHRQILRVRHALLVVEGQLHFKQTKSSRARSLYIDDVVTEALARQAAKREACPRPPDERHVRWDLAFTNDEGRHLRPATVTAAFARLVRQAPVPTIRLHDLRHTHATLMLAAGMPVQIVSQRLGHSRIDTTLKIYAHTFPAMDREAVGAFAAHVFGTDGHTEGPGTQGDGPREPESQRDEA